MAWVRYDDQFHTNAKVTAVIAENPAALALHVLANTWTNGQKRLGFIPKHQPGVLVCDRSMGAEWAEVLVRHGLWHERGHECAACLEEYAGLPDDLAGFVIHNSKEYRAPARERQTPGTPADLSEKRRLAGSKGGKQSAAQREQSKQTARANEANDASKASNTSSNSVSPVVNASNEALTPGPGPVPPSAGAASPRRAAPDHAANAGDVIAAYVEGATEGGQPRPSEKLRARVGRDAKRLLAEKGSDPQAVVDAARRMGAGGWQDIDVQIQRDAADAKPRASPGKSRNEQITDAAMLRAIAAEQRMHGQQPPDNVLRLEITP